MKRISNRLTLLFCHAAFGLLPVSALHSLDTSILTPPVRQDDEIEEARLESNRDKNAVPGVKGGCVRVWNFASGPHSKVDVLIEKDGEEAYFARAMRFSKIKNYHRYPAGEYTLIIKACEGAVPGLSIDGHEDQRVPREDEPTVGKAQVGEPEQNQPLCEPIPLKFADGDFYTVILREQGESLVAATLDDRMKPAGFEDPETAPKRLRLFHFAAGEVVSLEGDRPGMIWEDLVEGYHEQRFWRASGVTRFRLRFKLPGGRWSRKTMELDYSRARSCTVVILVDEYDRLTFRGLEDAVFGGD